MSRPKQIARSEPYLLVVDGESKTAKTTATAAVRAALEQDGYSVYEADAGVFFRRMTICVLEDLGITDLSHKTQQRYTLDTLHQALDHVIATDAAFAERHWPNAESPAVEQYVSMIGNATAAQHAMETWYDKTIEFAQARQVETLVVNARNPRARMKHWKPPVLDLLVYCDPPEAARRILYAQGNTSPTMAELDAQTAAVMERRRLDRHRQTFPFEDPLEIVDCDVLADAEPAAKDAVARSLAAHEPPATIRLNTTHISLERTVAGIAALARAALAAAE